MMATRGTAGDLTPMMRQYMEVKRAYPDCLLMFRLGDFYELFFEDAREAASILQITLTSRENKGQRIPMCGIPHHASINYISRLIAAGRRVVVCDQVEDPRKAKGLVKRAVTRVFTPGTLLEDEMLSPRANNYLLALAPGRDGRVGLAYADVSTGEFRACELAAVEEALAEVERIAPREILLPDGADELAERLASGESATLTRRDGYLFSPEVARERLLARFGVATLDGFGCEGMPQAVGAAGALLSYVEETQQGAATHLRRLSTYSPREGMALDPATQRNLGLFAGVEGRPGTALVDVLDETCTPMGARLLRRWLQRPLTDVRLIARRHEAVEDLCDWEMREKVGACLERIADLERLASRVACGTANPKDLLSLASSLRACADLARLGPSFPEGGLLRELTEAVDPVEEAASLIERAVAPDAPAVLRDGGVIREGYSEELDRLRRLSGEGRSWIAGLQQRERERTGISSLKVGYNKVFGYYIEVTKPNLHLVPEDYERRQTLAQAERFVTEELKAREAEVLGAQERARELEAELFSALVGEVAALSGRILATAAAVASIDALRSLAEAAVRRGWVRPVVDDSLVFDAREARHPVLEAVMGRDAFVPNDIVLDGERERLLIVTGPNMAGKSTYIRTAALLAILAQTGSFVPASRARIGLVDRVFTRIGASDDLARGMSTFLVEMSEAANILNNATERSLVILDEVGRGTSTFDGMSIAWAVAEDLHDRVRARTLFATHYHELTELGERLAACRNYTIAVREWEGKVIFLHRVVPGSADRSYGIHVAELAGLPAKVIERARHILEELESRQMAHKEGEPVQMPLFFPEHPLLERLRAIDVERLTPLEALTLLAELVREAGGRVGGGSGG